MPDSLNTSPAGTSADNPTIRPVADTGVLIEFADHIDDHIHQQVLDLDAAVQSSAPTGITELIPAYSCLFVGYDSLITDYDTVSNQIRALLHASDRATGNAGNTAPPQRSNIKSTPDHWQIPVCYDTAYAPDLPELSSRLNLSTEEIISQHTAGQYKVYMYGFAPGYAYLGGVPEAISIPRKPGPVMDIPIGSVMIAGPQSLITTVVMPSGWWVIGRTAKTPLQSSDDRPFLFSVGDTLEFVSVSEQEYLSQSQAKGQ